MNFAGARRWLFAALAVSVVLGLFQPRMDLYFADVLTRIGVAIILAVSLNLINGYTGQFSLGHAGFMAVGAYTAAAVTMFAGPKVVGDNPPAMIAQAWFLVALLLGGGAAAVAGVLVGAPSLRLRGDYLAIVTLGFGQIISVIFRNVESLGGALGLNGIPARTNLFWVFAAAALAVYVVTALVNSTYGRGFLATSDDEVAAQAMGINTTRCKIAAFVISAFFAGIAGGLSGHFTLTIDPKGFDFNRSIEIVVIVILGGMGNTPGVIAAAVLLTLSNEFLRPLQAYRPLLYALLLIVLMLARPQGLLNWKRTAKT
ncbi:MAG: branched-chain amino acid ABC transporter permease [Verrucomicrobia bacterium]|nr:branched-chain amino acid ABC transporter permease [Verrucomicrobiota bacterium]